MEIVAAEAGTKIRNVLFRFVIAGKNIGACGARREHGTHFFKTPRPAHQVTRVEIVVGLGVDQFLERSRVVMDIGIDEQLHGADSSVTRAQRSGPRAFSSTSERVPRCARLKKKEPSRW